MGGLLALPMSFLKYFISEEEETPLTFKKLLTIICLNFWRWMFPKRFNNYDFDEVVDITKTGSLPSQFEREIESPQNVEHLKEGADEVLFYGVNSSDESLVVRIARNDEMTAEAWLYLRLSSGKSYSLQEISKTMGDDLFNAAGLRIQCLSPLRTWRIFFNGLLRDGNDTIHVKFSFVWTALSDVFDMINETDIRSLANAIPQIPWRSSTLRQLKEMLDVYEQAGQMRGTITREGEEDIEMYLWGTKLRMLGKPDMLRNGKFYNVFGYMESGVLFHVGYGTIDKYFTNLQHGHLVEASGHVYPIRNCHRVSTGIYSDDPLMKKKFKFSAGKREYNLKLISSIHAVTFSSARWSDDIEIKHINIRMNGYNGRGIIIAGIFKETPQDNTKWTESSLSRTKKPKLNTNLLVAPFNLLECDEVELTGGKGSSLGKLSKLANDHNFIVPNGIVVTTAAYKEFVRLNKLVDAISLLEDITWGKTKGNTKDICEQTVDKVRRSLIPDDVAKAIEKQLKNLYNDQFNSIRFAVRSSASGEDSEELSAAGQMDTFLGIYGLKEILIAVKKCWASQFTFMATEYKRQNGQLLNTPMAVVIQEIANADIAGVMFTCDPVTSNPKYITITANYGLGESVVSAKAEPDVVILKRDSNQQLVVHDVTIGKKSMKIIIDEKHGTREEENTDVSSCSITNEQAVTLGNVGVQLEKEFGAPRDIEWCFVNGKLYLLQSRPITSIATETDFEIAHELDIMFRCENECLSKGNVGEVFPDATSPLGISFMNLFFGLTFLRKEFRRREGKKMPTCPFISKGLNSICNHYMFNVVDAWLRHEYDRDSPMAKTFMIASLGRIIDDDMVYTQADERYGDAGSFSQKIFNIIFLVRCLLFMQHDVVIHKKRFFKYQVNYTRFKTAKQLYDAMANHMISCNEGTVPHFEASFFSAFYNTILTSILANFHGEWNNDVYADFAYLLSATAQVESADVPVAMEKLAIAISKDISPSVFKEMDVEEAFGWLQTSSSNSSAEFADFLSKHGHRGLKEFDVQTQPWGIKPQTLVKTLQDLVISINPDKKKTVLSDKEMLKNLRISLDWKKYLILKFILPRCRHGVRMREMTKSLVIKIFDIFRKYYRHLGKMMVHEGRLPDEDLMYFLTHYEIGLLLETRSPRLIAKAVRRRKLHPALNRLKFPELMYGIPRPINTESAKDGISKISTTMKGIPVSCGVARGPAKVIMHLDEASSIQAGDILITYSTDIGWSPYFPLLAAVVTEIGGLISHGAVVAREYGLPGVVAIPGVISNFQTGDYVLVDGNHGIVQKIEAAEDGNVESKK